ncbi:sodium-dependent transporter [Endozoicomonadaceae bacterium StTr2]
MHQTQQFGSTFGFLMAATGFAVGLGNIWRFPYITGENGGGAFVLVYLCCVAFVAFPILMTELLVGQLGRGNPPQAIENIARAVGRSINWRYLGYLNLLTVFIIQGTYCVIAGWVLWYLYKAIVTGFSEVNVEIAALQFSNVTGSCNGMLFWMIIALLLTSMIIYAGVNKGIERSARVLMPIFFLLIVSLVILNATQAGFTDALDYLFTPDFSKINSSSILAAVGQAFFSVGVGMGCMLLFGAYLPQNVSITKCVLIIIAIDTCVALLAGLMIFPMVFRYGMNPDSGVGLVFQTMPAAFAQMSGGGFIAIVFFALLSVAAVTTMVGLMEPLVVWLESSFNFQRHQATACMLVAISCLGVLSALSYASTSGWTIASKDINGILDYLGNQIMLPVGGLMTTIFAAWYVGKKRLRSMLPMMPRPIFELWYIMLRFLLPVVIVAILVTGVS